MGNVIVKEIAAKRHKKHKKEDGKTSRKGAKVNREEKYEPQINADKGQGMGNVIVKEIAAKRHKKHKKEDGNTSRKDAKVNRE
jgi:hypothetical protein